MALGTSAFSDQEWEVLIYEKIIKTFVDNKKHYHKKNDSKKKLLHLKTENI